MKRVLVLIGIVTLLIGQGVLFVISASNTTQTDLNNFKVEVDNFATTEKAVVQIKSNNEEIEGMKIALPKNTKFNDVSTNESNQDDVNIIYEDSTHSLDVAWGENYPNDHIEFVLTDLHDETNTLTIKGITEESTTEVEEYSFRIEQEEIEEEEVKDQEVINEEKPEEDVRDKTKEDVKKSENEKKEQKDIDEKTSKKKTKHKSEKDAKKGGKSSKVDEDTLGKNKSMITPLVGDLNTDISISPYKKSVESGKVAMYKLVLKTTGSQKTYDDSTLVIKLPAKDYAKFTQDSDELKIAGVVPVYNEANETLVYEFADKLRAGETYETILKVETENYTSPNNGNLEAIATLHVADGNKPQEFTDAAKVQINSSSSVSISKEYIRAELSQKEILAPTLSSYVRWQVKVDIPKKDIGQMYLQEGSEIVVTDTLPEGLEFTKMNTSSAPQPTIQDNKITWTFDAPDLIKQAESTDSFFSKTLTFWTKVDNDKNLIDTTLENNVAADVTFIDGKILQPAAEASASIGIINREEATGEIKGAIVYPAHWGPADGKGAAAGNEVKDPNPPVHDDAYLRFVHSIHSMHPGKTYDMKEYVTYYKIDPNLKLEKLRTPGNWTFARTNAENRLNIPLGKDPVFAIEATVNGEKRTLVEDAEHGINYTRVDLGLVKTDHVSEIRLRFKGPVPAGMFSNGHVRYYFSVDDGYQGEVKNNFNIKVKPDEKAIKDLEDQNHKIDEKGQWWYRWSNRDTWDRLASDRHATIAPRPTDQPPIATIGVELLDHNSGEVVRGDNRMKVTLANNSSSTVTMREPLESVVLLPTGVTLHNNPKAAYTDNDGRETNGQYEVISDDYNGSGRQLVKLKWDEDRIRIGNSLTAELNVDISDGAPSTLDFDVYGFSGDKKLRVPSVSGDSITDTILQTDEDDLNGDGVTDQPRLKSGNIYTIRGQYDLKTEKFVKGELDDEWTTFGKTIPGGNIDYKLSLTNTTGKDISSMTLIDVLPSVGDLGITDNIARGSQFTPLMKEPITLPDEWKGKVNVSYSTAKNPERDDLIRNTKYPETTKPLTNPEGAEPPKWKTESEVEDWNTIHSFKIELKDGETWIEGVDMEVLFSMKAPGAKDIDSSLLDKDVDPKERAACNSFAVATDHGQPVEPHQVCAYMDFDIEEPTVEKTVENQKDPHELVDRDEEFTWEVDYDFGNYTGNWESASFQDEINNLLEIIDVTVQDQDKEDVSGNGVLDIDHDTNIVTFDLKQKDDSFAYLQDQTYTMIIKTKIKDDVTDEQLLGVIETGGIPNEAELIIDNDPTTSNEVKVVPPTPKGSLEITKVDKGTGEVLPDAEFELRDENNEVVASGTTDKDGKVTFDNLELGDYKLVETKAPEGYRLLQKPRDIKIEATDLHMEIEVENSKTDWFLPDTGGAGVQTYYFIAALLMLGSFMFLIKSKKAIK